MKTIFFVTIISFFTFSNISCTREATCEEVASILRDDHCNIVIQEKSGSGFQFKIKGVNPLSKRNEKFQRINYPWAFQFDNKITIGDTVVKKKGELIFYIHKKDTLLVFPFQCDGKIYE